MFTTLCSLTSPRESQILPTVCIRDNKAHYFGEKGEIIFHLDFVYHTSGVRTET